MSLKDIKESIEKEKICFGIRQAIKNKKKITSVFIAKDARDLTGKSLEKEGIKFSVLKPKKEMSKYLNLDFESEVFSILK